VTMDNKILAEWLKPLSKEEDEAFNHLADQIRIEEDKLLLEKLEKLLHDNHSTSK
jgi:hypothetical protein